MRRRWFVQVIGSQGDKEVVHECWADAENAIDAAAIGVKELKETSWRASARYFEVTAVDGEPPFVTLNVADTVGGK